MIDWKLFRTLGLVAVLAIFGWIVRSSYLEKECRDAVQNRAKRFGILAPETAEERRACSAAGKE